MFYDVFDFETGALNNIVGTHSGRRLSGQSTSQAEGPGM